MIFLRELSGLQASPATAGVVWRRLQAPGIPAGLRAGERSDGRRSEARRRMPHASTVTAEPGRRRQEAYWKPPLKAWTGVDPPEVPRLGGGGWAIRATAR